jgi:hypothetical protein
MMTMSRKLIHSTWHGVKASSRGFDHLKTISSIYKLNSTHYANLYET